MPKNHDIKPPTGHLELRGYPPVLRVTTTKELWRALHGNEPFIVADKLLRFLLWWFLAFYTVEQAFNLFSQADRVEIRTEWRQDRTFRNEIIVTPREPRAPRSLSDVE